MKTDQSPNPYEDLRNKALSMQPKDLGLDMQDLGTIVYGLVADWNINSIIATISAFNTGDASLYVSSGYILIGGFAHKTVRKAVAEYLDLAQKYFHKAKKTDTTDLPKENCVKFYFLTKNGIYVGEENISRLEDSSSVWLELFQKYNEVMSALSIIAQSKNS